MSLYHWTHIFMSYLCVFKRSLLGVKIWLSHAQIGLLLESQKAWATPRWSPLGVKFKISHEHPRLFRMGVEQALDDYDYVEQALDDYVFISLNPYFHVVFVCF